MTAQERRTIPQGIRVPLGNRTKQTFLARNLREAAYPGMGRSAGESRCAREGHEGSLELMSALYARRAGPSRLDVIARRVRFQLLAVITRSCVSVSVCTFRGTEASTA